ncbi:MAG TPA: hypothetical protein VGJ93_01885 [Desulfuromonadaceae bacterium]|jgi:hypothetical protein
MSNEELLSAPTLAGQFPINFRNGFRINTLLFWCPSCNSSAPLAKVHGYISRIVEGVADVTAAMRCSCGKITRYRIRLRDDKSFSYLNNNRWIDKTIVVPFRKRIISSIRLKLLLWLLKWKHFQLMRQVKKLQNSLKKQLTRNYP